MESFKLNFCFYFYYVTDDHHIFFTRPYYLVSYVMKIVMIIIKKQDDRALCIIQLKVTSILTLSTLFLQVPTFEKTERKTEGNVVTSIKDVVSHLKRRHYFNVHVATVLLKLCMILLNFLPIRMKTCLANYANYAKKLGLERHKQQERHLLFYDTK